MTDKLKNYIERQRNWQDKSMEQLSFANNFLLTISTGLFAYFFDKEKEVIANTTLCLCRCEFDLSLTFCALSFVFLILSVMTGILVLISRLYDFRISRHIALIRQRFYEKNEVKITDEDRNAAVLPHDDFDYPNFSDRVNTVCKVLFIKIDFFKKDEMQTSKSTFDKQKFKYLRELSYRLGTISWKWTKMQGLYIFTGIVLYTLYVWTK